MSNKHIIVPEAYGEIVYNCQACNAFCCNYGHLIMDEISARYILQRIPHLSTYTSKKNGVYRVDMGGCNCWFLKNGECDIQDIKPISCVLFPNKIIKGPENYYVVLQTLCPTSYWSKAQEDKKELFKYIIEEFPVLVQDYGVKFEEKSHNKGVEITWKERFFLENEYAKCLEYSHDFEIKISEKDTAYVLFSWIQLRLSPNFLETDFAIINSLFTLYYKSFFDIYRRINMVLKSIQHAMKTVTDELYINYKCFRVNVSGLQSNVDIETVYSETYEPLKKNILDFTEEWQVLFSLGMELSLSHTEIVLFLKQLQRKTNVQWKPIPYNSVGEL